MLELRLSPARHALIVATLAVGLALDMRTDLFGQVVLSGGVWAVLAWLLKREAPAMRHAMLICLAIATAGELFLSLVWGLYTYRLDNVPLFVPPGHVLLLLLALSLSQRMNDRLADAVIAAAGLYALIAAAIGFDTLSVPLFLVMAAAACAMPAQRRLYATTFLCALALECYGTWLGNWTWAPRVPWLPLVTSNPPGVASAFYCALDALVAAVILLRRSGRPVPDSEEPIAEHHVAHRRV